MKVAIVYDRVNKYGGAERFLETILSMFPSAPLFTLVHNPQKSGWAKKTKVIPTFLNKIPFLRSHHEILAPIAPMAFETLDLSPYDLVISVTSADAKAVLTNSNQIHICICLTPTRYLWSGHKYYSRDIKMRILPKFILNYFRFVDLVTANRPDHYIAISKEVQRRINEYYETRSTVIYPPLNKIFLSLPKKVVKENFYLLAGRQVGYKKSGLVVKAFNKLGKKLMVVGDGAELNNLKKIANKNISFLGRVSDKELIRLYRQAKALVFPNLEDFGLIPLESQAMGTPVIAYGAGGALETVIDKVTGIFFKKQTTKSLIKAIKTFERSKFKPEDCIQNARRFSESTFKKELQLFIDQVTKA